MPEIMLGNKVKDTVSGLVGIAVSRIEYINGCIQYGVKPPVDKDGKMVEVDYIDEGQLKVAGEGVCHKPKPRGGCCPDSPSYRRSDHPSHS